MCSRSVGILVNHNQNPYPLVSSEHVFWVHRNEKPFGVAQRPGELRPRLRPPRICRDLQPHRIHVGRNFTVWIPRVDSKDPSALHGEGRNFWEDGAPNSLPWTTQHLGGLESALVAFEKRHIRSESLGGGVVRRCRSWSGKSQQYVGPTQFV